jgi:hypothetical protein
MYYITSSGLRTADAAILARGGLVHAVTIIPAAAASSVAIYDNASAGSGTVLAQVNAVANGESVTVEFSNPIAANLGIYADVTGASASYIVHYSIA